MSFVPRSAFLEAALARGFLHQATHLEDLDARMAARPITAYVGFDLTADSLHVGSLVSIMLLRLLQKTGHKPIVLLGGGTTRIGDPSGKTQVRPLLSDDEIAKNRAGIAQIFSRFLTFGDGPTDAVLVDNSDWLDGLAHIAFLREVGRHFSVNRMLGLDSVRTRLEREDGLSLLEFSYMVLQAYDFVELARRHDCVLQMGGSDQWGNIVMGVELARRMDGSTLFGLTTPLIATARGEKMGKTADGAIWLDGDRLSAFKYWQFWRNTADADLGRFLRLFTELPLEEIDRLEALKGAELNAAKIVLATEATALVHGRGAAEDAAETARRVFEEGGIGGALPQLEVPRADLLQGRPLVQLLHAGGLAESLGAARRLIRGGGARVNNVRIENEHRLITLDDITADGVVKLSAGRQRHVLLYPTDAGLKA